MNALVILLLIAVAPEAATSALPRAAGWTTSRLLASPYATQAAAADGNNVYVISSTTVARYDRTTGRLTATATTRVQRDIVKQLGIPEANSFIRGFARDDLAIEIVECARSERPELLGEMLAAPWLGATFTTLR